MSILVDKNTRVLCQGFLKAKNLRHLKQCIAHGTNIVGLVLPSKNIQLQVTLPIFHSVKKAVKKTKANATVIALPPSFCKDAIIEALEANIKIIVCLTNNLPIHDVLQIKSLLKLFDAYLIGPNAPGIISPGKGKIGFIFVDIHRPGNIGVVSCSSTLMYELTAQITQLGFGQSTCVGIGNDTISGLHFIDILKLFEKDPQTKTILLVGEIGRCDEEETAKFIKKQITKPVIAYIAGLATPEQARLRHLSPFVMEKSKAKKKIDAFKNAGVKVVQTPSELRSLLLETQNGKRKDER